MAAIVGTSVVIIAVISSSVFRLDQFLFEYNRIMASNFGPGMNQEIHRNHWDGFIVGGEYTIYEPTARNNKRESIWRRGVFTGRRNHRGDPIFREKISRGMPDGNLDIHDYRRDFPADSARTIYAGFRGWSGGKRKTLRKRGRRVTRRR